MPTKVSALAIVAVAATLSAQTPAPPAAAPRPAGPSPVSPDLPSNFGRKALVDYLNSLGYQETAARRAVIAKITTREQAEARQHEVRAKILALMGTLPERIPLNARTTGSSTLEDGTRVDKVLFDSQPNFPITALLYTPAGGSGKFPAIILAPGHGPAGKASDVATATQLAKNGFIVLSYDPIGQGERLQYLDPKSPADKPVSLAERPTGEHGEAGIQPTLIGDALARYFLWDGMRAVDYLESLPNVDAKRIGAFGCSGGGTMTALLAALDPRVSAAAVACYTTSFDELLPSATGVQDSEQSTPNFIASGLDFPDWSELFAPKPYAIVATTNDMFPFAGAQSTFAESQHFFSLFGAADSLHFIFGPGGHGNLRPIMPQILHFFVDALHPDAAYAKNLPEVTDPFTAPQPARGGFPPPPSASLVQVTPTGQLATSFPGTATVFTLNEARAAKVRTPELKSLAEAQAAVREVTHAVAMPGSRPVGFLKAWTRDGITSGFLEPDNIDLETRITLPVGDAEAGAAAAGKAAKHPAILLLVPNAGAADPAELAARAAALCTSCKGATPAVMVFTPRPEPAGDEETKAKILGNFYLTGLRAQLVGKTLLGMRVDDTLRAVDFFCAQAGVDCTNLTVDASGHLGLVLLHAAVLDSRIRHANINGALASYRGLMKVPMPADEPQDGLPAVLQHYDIPELVRLLGSRAEVRNPVIGK